LLTYQGFRLTRTINGVRDRVSIKNVHLQYGYLYKQLLLIHENVCLLSLAGKDPPECLSEEGVEDGVDEGVQGGVEVTQPRDEVDNLPHKLQFKLIR
jgi:hypothetical protein